MGSVRLIRNTVTLKGKLMLRMFGPYVLRNILVPKRVEVTGDWRKIAQ
jgi:hypothetical protein